MTKLAVLWALLDACTQDGISVQSSRNRLTRLFGNKDGQTSGQLGIVRHYDARARAALRRVSAWLGNFFELARPESCTQHVQVSRVEMESNGWARGHTSCPD